MSQYAFHQLNIHQIPNVHLHNSIIQNCPYYVNMQQVCDISYMMSVMISCHLTVTSRSWNLIMPCTLPTKKLDFSEPLISRAY